MDSPVLWLRIDPEMTLLREVILEQPDYQWTYQLRYERDVIAQMESLAVLDRFNTKQAWDALLEVITSEATFYRVRCQATTCLRRVANLMGASWIGPPALLPQFRKLFGSPSCPNIVRMNNFSHFQHYFLQMAIFRAVAGLRTLHGICPAEVLRFLFDLFKYNDNSKNAFTDAYYRAALVDALAETVTPVAIAPIFNAVTGAATAAPVVDMLSPDTKSILEEITRSFNLDKLLPCYQNVVTVSCLRAIRHLQRMGHLPSSGAIFRAHTSHNCYVAVRKAAIEILVDIVRAEGRKEDLDFLLDDLVVGDPQPVIKFYTLKYLIKNPPFSFLSEEQCPLDTEELVEKLWALMNGGTFATDSRLRCAVVDLYYVLYGRGRPRCLPKPEFSFILNIAKEKVSLPPPPPSSSVPSLPTTPPPPPLQPPSSSLTPPPPPPSQLPTLSPTALPLSPSVLSPPPSLPLQPQPPPLLPTLSPTPTQQQQQLPPSSSPSPLLPPMSLPLDQDQERMQMMAAAAAVGDVGDGQQSTSSSSRHKEKKKKKKEKKEKKEKKKHKNKHKHKHKEHSHRYQVRISGGETSQNSQDMKIHLVTRGDPAARGEGD